MRQFFHSFFTSKDLGFTLAPGFFTAALVFSTALGSAHFGINDPAELVGIATALDFDVAARVGFYWRWLLLTPMLILLFSLLLHWLLLKKIIGAVMLKPTALISIGGISALLMTSSSIRFDNLPWIFFIALVAVLIHGAVSYRLGYRWINHDAFLMVALPTVWLCLWPYLWPKHGWEVWQIVTLHTAITMAALWIGKSHAAVTRAWLSATLLVGTLPVLAQEIHHVRLQQFHEFDEPRMLLLAAIGLLGLVGALGLRLGWFRWRWWVRSSPVFLIVSVLCFTRYSAVIWPSSELFEMANPANSLLRVFEFGQWPIFDFLSSHMLSEQVFGYLYYAINPWLADQSHFSYFFLFDVLGAIFQYVLIRHAFKNAYVAVLVVLLLPSIGILLPTVFVFAAPALLAAVGYYKKPSLGRWWWWVAALVLVLLWRLDLGFASAVVALTAAPLVWFVRRKEIQFRSLMASTAAGLALVVIVAFILFWFNPAWWQNAQLALSYFGASQAHAFSAIVHQWDFSALFHYFFLPGALLLLCVFWLLPLAFQRDTEAFSLLALSVFYFANLPRGLVRHSLIEHTDLYTVSIGYFIVFWLLFRALRRAHGSFSMLTAVLIVLVLMKATHVTASPDDAPPAMASFLDRFPSMKFHHADASGSRVEGQEEHVAPYSPLVQVLDSVLAPTETFFDLTAHPMLYYITKRTVPSYFNQGLWNELTPLTMRAALNWLSKNEPPIVIYADTNGPAHEEFDGLANAHRFASIYDFVHRNYTPWKLVSGHHLWLRNDLQGGSFSCLTVEAATQKQLFNFEYLPAVSARNLQWSQWPVLVAPQPFEFGQKLRLKGRAYALLIATNTAAQIGGIELSCQSFGHQFATIFLRLNPSETPMHYLVPLHYGYGYYTAQQPELSLNWVTEGAAIHSVSILTMP